MGQGVFFEEGACGVLYSLQSPSLRGSGEYLRGGSLLRGVGGVPFFC